jgi:hypothetical protein
MAPNLAFTNHRPVFRTTSTLLLILVALFGAYCAYDNAKQSVTSLERGKRFAAASLTQLNQSQSRSQRAAALKERSSRLLRQIDAQSVRLVAEGYLASGNTRNGFGLLDLARRLTRRDAATHILLIEQNASRDNLREVVMLYDEALRTNGASRSILFPILASALQDEDVASAFAPIFKSRPNWATEFYYFAGFKPESTVATARLITRARSMPDDQYSRQFQTRFLAHLFDSRLYDDARKFYSGMPGAELRLLSDVRFLDSNVRDRVRPISWELKVEDAAEAAFIKDDANSNTLKLRIQAVGAITKIVAYRYVYLRPGSYHLKVFAETAEMTKGSELNWTIECLDLGQTTEIGRLTLLPKIDKLASFKVPFLVSSNCKVMRLSALMKGGNDDSASTAVVDQVLID